MSSTVIIVIGLLVTLPYITPSLYTPPDITTPKAHSLEYVPASRNVVLNCSATGTAPITFKWRRNWEDIVTDGSIFTVDENTGTLTIQSFTLREQGQYQCLAENVAPNQKRAVAVSPVLTLVQEQLATDWPDTPVQTIRHTEGDYARMSCTNVPVSVPKARFSWFLVGNDGEKNQIKTDDRIYVDNTGTLHFVYLQLTDRHSDAKYLCAIYNTKDALILGSPYDLFVDPRSGSIPTVSPVNKFRTSNVTFLLLRSAELECVFSGYPVPSIKWFIHGREIFSNDKYTVQNHKLMVNDLKYEDEGDYTCEATNSGGSLRATAHLSVSSGPVWENALSSRTIPEGKSAKFTCQARDRDRMLPDPVWFLNGADMPASPGDNFEYSEGRTVLTVTNLKKPDDIMCFQCNVSNRDGFEFDSACLNVIEPIVIVISPPPEQEIGKGDVVDFTVSATTDPDLTLKDMWYFKDVIYDANRTGTTSGKLPPHVVHNAVSNTYYMNTSSLTDEEFNAIQGVYYREFYNDFERKNVTTTVTVKGPIPGPVAEATFPWWVIVLVIVLIVLILLLILIILCCCRNKDKGDYKIYKTELNTAYLDPDQDLENNKFKDVARIEDDENPDVKTPLKLGPAYDLSGDEADSLDQYQGGKPPRNSFADDASFIGLYATKESQDL